VRGELPPRRAPWFYDNGAFADYRAARPFDGLTFERDMRRLRLWMATGVPRWAGQLLPPPRFLVLPDVVAAGRESLVFSEAFLPGGVEEPLGGLPAVPLYLAVQDGMQIAEVAALVVHRRLGGLFVGGSLPWKLATGAQWVRVAHRLGVPCHIGRCVARDRLRWALRIGADSVDGNAPNWSAAGLALLRQTRSDRQLELLATRNQ
jgi:hypothetical protein